MSTSLDPKTQSLPSLDGLIHERMLDRLEMLGVDTEEFRLPDY
jgi:hypothetical protein